MGIKWNSYEIKYRVVIVAKREVNQDEKDLDVVSRALYQ